MAKKKPSKTNPALAKLLNAGIAIENKINSHENLGATGLKSENEINDPKKDVKINVSKRTQADSETQETGKYEYARYFEKHLIHQQDKRDTLFLYTTLRKRLKKLTEAEDSTLNDLMNNIVEDWMNQHEKEIKSSLKKLSSW